MFNKKILITGCSSGIGLASAQFLANQGWHVYATVRQQADVDKLKRLKLDNLHPLLLDITDLAGIKNTVSLLERDLANTGLDVLINNAGHGLAFPLEHADDDYIEQHISTNISGTINMTRAFIPLLKIAHGRIINISSGAGNVAIPLMAMYSASKFAIEGFSDALRVELSQSEIKVIIMQPGVVETHLHQKIEANNHQLSERLDQAAWLQYGKNITMSVATHSRARHYAIDMCKFTGQLAKAVSHKRPKTRYIIGLDAKIMAFVSPLVSDRLKDWIWKKLLGF